MMKVQQRRLRSVLEKSLLFFMILSAAFGAAFFYETNPIQSASLQSWGERELIVSGRTVGLDLYTDGILVLGTGRLTTEAGEVDSPAKGLIYAGDCIDAVNGITVQSAQEVQSRIADSGAKEVILTLRRQGQSHEVAVQPVQTDTREYKIGLWIRDRAQGIGTLTFYDPQSGGYGAVGHGIADVDTGELLPVGNGSLTGARVRGLTKGESGVAGEVEASLTPIFYGEILANTEEGIFGIGEAEAIEGERYPIAFRSEIQNGKAYVMTDLVTGTPELYSVKIEKVMTGVGGRSAMIVEITDERLLAVTGGIIQGMSGAPLLQNGHLIGAVTHVFLKDPTRGYGIYIEDMLEEMLSSLGD